MMATGRRRIRRGFTLLEVMLAAMLGTMVVIACLGLFRAIEQQTIAGRARFSETMEIGMVHSAAERAIQLLLMSDAPRPTEPGAGGSESAGDGEEDAGADSGAGSEANQNDRGEDGRRGRGGRSRRDRGSQNQGNRAGGGENPAASDPSSGSAGGESRAGRSGGGGGGGAGGSNRRGRDAAAAALVVVPETPRFDLSFDPAMTGSMEVFDRDGNRRRIQPQRLEVALRSAPVFVPSARGPVQTEEERRRESNRERRARERQENEAPALTEATIAPGIRGAFELNFEPGPDLDGDGLGGSYSLWWRQITPDPAGGEFLADAVAAEQVDWPEGLGPGRIRLASNLKRVHWQVYRGSQWRDEWSATWVDDLPAYVSLEIETAEGTNYQWLLEVGWSVGKDPGSPSASSPEAGADADAGADGQGRRNRGGGNAEPIRNRDPNRVPASGDNAPGGRGRGRSGR